ncbi:hypothetical protein VTI74DRAFT_957 [Chaetomium olivicolor]
MLGGPSCRIHRVQIPGSRHHRGQRPEVYQLHKRRHQSVVHRQILDQFYSRDAVPVAFTLEDLNCLEKTWAGHIRQGRRGGLCTKTTRLYTAYVVVYYLSPSWEQIRELCLVSIAERALDVLVAEFLPGARNRAPTLQWSAADYFQAGKLVLDTIVMLRSQADIRENLLACISRLCRRFG